MDLFDSAIFIYRPREEAKYHGDKYRNRQQINVRYRKEYEYAGNDREALPFGIRWCNFTPDIDRRYLIDRE